MSKKVNENRESKKVKGKFGVVSSAAPPKPVKIAKAQSGKEKK